MNKHLMSFFLWSVIILITALAFYPDIKLVEGSASGIMPGPEMRQRLERPAIRIPDLPKPVDGEHIDITDIINALMQQNMILAN